MPCTCLINWSEWINVKIVGKLDSLTHTHTPHYSATGTWRKAVRVQSLFRTLTVSRNCSRCRVDDDASAPYRATFPPPGCVWRHAPVWHIINCFAGQMLGTTRHRRCFRTIPPLFFCFVFAIIFGTTICIRLVPDFDNLTTRDRWSWIAASGNASGITKRNTF